MLPKTVFSHGKLESSSFTSIGCFRRLFLVMGGLYHRILSATGSKAEGLFSHARRKRVGGFQRRIIRLEFGRRVSRVARSVALAVFCKPRVLPKTVFSHGRSVSSHFISNGLKG